MNPFPSDKILKRMGYFFDQEGIVNRYINEEGNWQGHLKNTKDFITDCISKNKPDNVAILGSGWLLDIPIDYLAENCRHIYLYDIRHPRQIVHKLRNKSNVTFISCDLTGGAIEEVYRIVKNNDSVTQRLDELTIPGFVASEPLDFIISVNILNQLDSLLLEYLNESQPIDKTITDKFRAKIQFSHIQSLLKHSSALITDYEELIYDRTDKLISENSLLYTHLPNARFSKEWLWQFDTQMTYYPNRKTFFKVIALQF